MVKTGDILTIDGKKVVVTATDGVNYAYAPAKEEVKEEKKEVKTRRKKD